LSTGEREIAVLGELVGGQTDGLAAVSQFAGDQEADGTDQLELRATDASELDEQTIDAVHCQRHHDHVALLRQTDLHSSHPSTLASLAVI